MQHVKHRRLRIGLVLGALLLGALVFAGVGRGEHGGAHWPQFSHQYTRDQCGGSGPHAVDPINVVFRGSNAGLPNTVHSIERHASWGDPSGSDQFLFVRMPGGTYDCFRQGDQRADGTSLESRFHTRLWFIPNSADSETEKKTVGDAHHEDVIVSPTNVCHAVDENGDNGSGFDQGRRELVDAFSAPEADHNVKADVWGNTRNFAQCDANNPDATEECQNGPATSDFCDGWAGSNGIGNTIRIDHIHIGN